MFENSGIWYKKIAEMYLPLQDLIKEPFLLAGGCIGDVVSFGRSVKDYDFMFKNYNQMHTFEDKIKSLGFKFTGESDTVRQYKFLNLNFDVITWQVKETANDFIKTFDFTVNAMILDGNILYHHENSIEHCIAKKIVAVRNLDFQHQYRVKRYIDKGYNVDSDSPLYDILYNRKPVVETETVMDENIVSVNLSQFL